MKITKLSDMMIFFQIISQISIFDHSFEEQNQIISQLFTLKSKINFIFLQNHFYKFMFIKNKINPYFFSKSLFYKDLDYLRMFCLQNIVLNDIDRFRRYQSLKQNLKKNSTFRYIIKKPFSIIIFYNRNFIDEPNFYSNDININERIVNPTIYLIISDSTDKVFWLTTSNTIIHSIEEFKNELCIDDIFFNLIPKNDISIYMTDKR